LTSKPKQSGANGTVTVKSAFLTGND